MTLIPEVCGAGSTAVVLVAPQVLCIAASAASTGMEDDVAIAVEAAAAAGAWPEMLGEIAKQAVRRHLW